ncbi:hypothetical protein [Acrocarpospora catenulata]|uniref:hypothetical protein n=1 Tax=Acrocarpospora catenulata TaxID=2836182 RepID=UPI001BD934FB|nr:hypothetical protein [Acrocarpospora catenulata]
MAAVALALTFCAAIVLPVLAAPDAYAWQRPAAVASPVRLAGEARSSGQVLVMMPRRATPLRSSIWYEGAFSGAPDHSCHNPVSTPITLTDFSKLETWHGQTQAPGQGYAAMDPTVTRTELSRPQQRTTVARAAAAARVPGGRGPPR